MRSVSRLRLFAVVSVLFAAFFVSARTSHAAIPANHIRIHYHRTDGIYTGWTVYAFGDTTEDTNNFGGGPVQISGSDSFGAYFDVGITSGAKDVGIIVHMGNTKDPGPDEHVNPSTQGIEYWQLSGVTGLFTSEPSTGSQKNPNLPANTARVHFFRPDGVYTNWTVYAFDDTTADTGNYNGGPIQVTGNDSFGAYFDVPLKVDNPQDLGFIVHNIVTGMKNTPADLHLNVAIYNEAWIVSGDPTVYLTQPTPQQLLNGNFLKSQAFWIDRSTVLIQEGYAQSSATYALISDGGANLQLTATGVTGGVRVGLTPGGTLTAAQIARFPQLATGYTVLTLPADVQPATYLGLVQGQLAVSVTSSDGTLHYATGVQQAGVLDDLYAYDGKLGAVFNIIDGQEQQTPAANGWRGDIRIKVWAPTAQSMKLQLFNEAADVSPAEVLPMQQNNGVWVATIRGKWLRKYYLFDETVYSPSARSIVENFVTDPYSVDLSINGSKSRLNDLDNGTFKPDGWDEDRSPTLDRINDLSIYELHVRDFSIGDATVPAAHRGSYLAFTDTNSDGMRHLRTLSAAGLKAIHLLPTFHFNSVNEDKSTWATTPDLSGFAPDSQSQQAAVTAVESKDGYNWGYDPDHYLAPEGSYATDPEQRVKEYRRMVMALHRAGLRVIQDVVFNHTSGFGEASNSILDEVVPDYYNRLDMDGNLENASCCADTATEHVMMGKLQKDAVLWNAKEYKIDGFRFDIMSFTFISNLQSIRNSLRKLTLDKDGIDGSKIYIYGEGFNFGETANSALGLNASQLNLYGYGFGTFNDRIRDGVRGGGPFGDIRPQGFATGEFNDPNAYSTANIASSDQKADLLHRTDWVRVGLTGNLRDYKFTDATGATTTGGQLDYQGQPTGYTASPIEAVNYASAHDNQILFDAIQVKAAEQDSSTVRARRQVFANSIIELGQGIPFFTAGDDLLRSKDMDGNSYDSGDWFNKIDWTGTGNNWGIGLPVASQNSSNWFIEQPLLANGAYKPTQTDILSTTDTFQEFLKIRNSSPLFRIAAASEIQGHLRFLDQGPSQVPGMIVMYLNAPDHGDQGPYKHIVVVFNGTSQEQTFTSVKLKGLSLRLHPVQTKSADPVVRTSSADAKAGTVTVPAVTTAVFVSEE